jgi:RsiW-degrading membrane proteinase PrsW (M82 family)
MVRLHPGTPPTRIIATLRQTVEPGVTGMVWITIALVFAGVWIYAFVREDIHDREPWWLLAVALLAGAASMFPALWLEGLLLPNGVDQDGPLIERLKAVFLVAGPVEEFCKFAAVWLLIWPRAHFSEPVDGLIYGVMAATGFATAENFYYMQGEPKIILARGPITVAAHIMFASFWGGAMGDAHNMPSRAQRFVVITLGVLMAALVHGCFNAIEFAKMRELSLAQGRTLEILLVAVCFGFLRWRMRVALARSPFHRRNKGL